MSCVPDISHRPPSANRDLPMRVAAFDLWRSLRDAHGPIGLRGRPTLQRERAFADRPEIWEARVATLTQALTT
jgi:hypothetical protein